MGFKDILIENMILAGVKLEKHIYYRHINKKGDVLFEHNNGYCRHCRKQGGVCELD